MPDSIIWCHLAPFPSIICHVRFHYIMPFGSDSIHNMPCPFPLCDAIWLRFHPCYSIIHPLYAYGKPIPNECGDLKNPVGKKLHAWGGLFTSTLFLPCCRIRLPATTANAATGLPSHGRPSRPCLPNFTALFGGLTAPFLDFFQVHFISYSYCYKMPRGQCYWMIFCSSVFVGRRGAMFNMMHMVRGSGSVQNTYGKIKFSSALWKNTLSS